MRLKPHERKQRKDFYSSKESGELDWVYVAFVKGVYKRKRKKKDGNEFGFAVQAERDG